VPAVSAYETAYAELLVVLEVDELSSEADVSSDELLVNESDVSLPELPHPSTLTMSTVTIKILNHRLIFMPSPLIELLVSSITDKYGEMMEILYFSV
jgi:hypothetical protein